jgi:hypothetical protein
MNLDDAQRQKVAEWIGQGLKLSDIQTRLASELGLGMTYMEVRLLVDDLKLTPKDIEPPKPVESVLSPGGPTKPAGAQPPAGRQGAAGAKAAPPAGQPGRVSVTVDQLARPGSVVSGQVTFSDGNTAYWQFDELGQLGLAPQKAGYRPPAADVEQFQTALDAELRKLGL